MSFGLSVQAACYVPLIGDFVDNFYVQVFLLDKGVKATESDQASRKIENLKILDEANKLCKIGIVRNLLSIAGLITGIATGVLLTDCAILGVITIGCLAINRAFCIHKNTQKYKELTASKNIELVKVPSFAHF